MTARFETNKALTHHSLGISISASEDTAGLGLDIHEVNRAVLQISEAVLGQGARVVFGHDWRPDGVMETVLTFAMGYHRRPAFEDGGAPMTNFLAWPDRASLSADRRKHYEGMLDVIEFDQPALPDGVMVPPGKEANLLLRVMALTEMRTVMASKCTARICAGGPTSGSQGLCAGIFEEAALSAKLNKPIYVTSLFGGAGAQVVRALSGRPMTKPVTTPKPEISAVLENVGLPTDASEYETILKDKGLKGLSEDNGLSIDQNQQLFAAQSLSEVIGWVLHGLSQLKK